jgi:glycerol-3-phosphate acyltransferase PlsY
VATSLGVIVALDPALGVIGLLAFAVVVALSRISALGSLAGTGAAVAGAWLWRGEALALPSRIALLCICGLIVWRHRSNLQAMRQPEEPDE